MNGCWTTPAKSRLTSCDGRSAPTMATSAEKRSRTADGDVFMATDGVGLSLSSTGAASLSAASLGHRSPSRRTAARCGVAALTSAFTALPLSRRFLLIRTVFFGEDDSGNGDHFEKTEFSFYFGSL